MVPVCCAMLCVARLVALLHMGVLRLLVATRYGQRNKKWAPVEMGEYEGNGNGNG